jgi:hypothetical protein
MQDPPLLIIGSLWEQAADSLDQCDRKKLDLFLKRKREGEVADAPKDGGSPPPEFSCMANRVQRVLSLGMVGQ